MGEGGSKSEGGSDKSESKSDKMSGAVEKCWHDGLKASFEDEADSKDIVGEAIEAAKCITSDEKAKAYGEGYKAGIQARGGH